MRIGIPKGLLFYKFGELWQARLRAAGLEVVTSPSTNPEILEAGLKHSVCDLCLPVKVFFGHVHALKDDVDALFIPRGVRTEPDSYLCPKFIGLPDMVRAAIRRLPPVIDTEYNVKERSDEDFWKEVFAQIGHKIQKTEEINSPYPFCKDKKEDSEETERQARAFSVGVAGRPYLVYDNYLNKGIIRHIRRLGIEVVFQTPSAEYIRETMDTLPKWIYWSMAKEVVASVRWMIESEEVDGIILLVNAGCGPDSFMTELIERTMDIQKKPYMSINIDEHTSDVGLQTRVEAFIDMIDRRMKTKAL